MLDPVQIGFWHGLSCTHDAAQPTVAGTCGGKGAAGAGGGGEQVRRCRIVTVPLCSLAQHFDKGWEVQNMVREGKKKHNKMLQSCYYADGFFCKNLEQNKTGQ